MDPGKLRSFPGCSFVCLFEVLVALWCCRSNLVTSGLGARCFFLVGFDFAVAAHLSGFSFQVSFPQRF